MIETIAASALAALVAVFTTRLLLRSRANLEKQRVALIFEASMNAIRSRAVDNLYEAWRGRLTLEELGKAQREYARLMTPEPPFCSVTRQRPTPMLTPENMAMLGGASLVKQTPPDEPYPHIYRSVRCSLVFRTRPSDGPDSTYWECMNCHVSGTCTDGMLTADEEPPRPLETRMLRSEQGGRAARPGTPCVFDQAPKESA